MSFLLLHDTDNFCRGASISAPSTRTWSDASRLTDGLLALPWQGSAVGTHTITLAQPVARPLSFVAVLDLRASGPIQSISLSAWVDGAWVTPPGWQAGWPASMALDEAAMWWIAPPGAEVSTAQIRVIVVSEEPRSLSIGEIVAGDPLRFRGGYRELVHGTSYGVVENGPWRARVAAPRRSLELRFPVLEEDYVGAQLRISEGGLRPVVLLPDPSEALIGPLHGHLDDDWSATRELAGWWRGQVLRFTESERPL